MRMVADCRDFPSESGCTLTISGEGEEVVKAAAEHAVSVHGHTDGPELRAEIRTLLKPETPPALQGYGTTMIAKLRGTRAEVEQSLVDWERERQVPGFVAGQLMFADDGKTVVNTAIFESREAYQALADDPQQGEWYDANIAPHLDGEAQWIDGDWFGIARTKARITLPSPAPAPAG